MLKNLFIIQLFLICLIPFSSSAEDTTEQKYNQEGRIVLNTISNLENEGFITSKNATEAKKKFVFDNSDYLQKSTYSKTPTTDNGITWTEYVTLTNTMKLIAIIALLIAFRGLIMKFINLFTKIPQFVYQLMALSLSLCATFLPEQIWVSQAHYISIFGVFSNLIILGWIIATYEEQAKKILNYFSLNIPPEITAFVYATLYFGFFTVYMDSYFLGIFAAISFVGIFTFTIQTTGISTYIGYDNENFAPTGMAVSYLIVLAYSLISINGVQVPYLELFSVGIEYVLTIVATISLLIFTSFIFQEDKIFGSSIVLFIIAFIGANTGGILYGLEVIPAIVNTGFVLFILGWLNYFTTKVSGILTMFVAGVSLYGTAVMIENYPEYFVTALF